MSKMGHKNRKNRLRRAGYYLALVEQKVPHTSREWTGFRYEDVTKMIPKKVKLWKKSQEAIVKPRSTPAATYSPFYEQPRQTRIPSLRVNWGASRLG